MQGDRPPEPTEISEATFVGRRLELRALAAAASRAESGRGSLMLVSGEAGIGKTSLVQEALGSVGATVSLATCWEGDGTPPFWPWTQLVRSLLSSTEAGELRRSLPDEVAACTKLVGEHDLAAETSASRFVLFDSVATLLLRAADGTPRVFVIEDLHWADEASIGLLHFLSRRLVDSRVLVVGTYRDTDLVEDHPLARCLADLALGAHLHLALSGLGVDDLEAMLIDLLGDGRVLPALVSFLHHKTAGNPFFARELIELLVGEGRVEQVGVDSRVAVPTSVSGVLLRRFARLNHTTSDVLAAASVLDGEIDLHFVRAMTGLGSEDLLGALDEAARRGLVVEDRDTPARFRFAHALVREVLYEQLPIIERMNAHRRVGEAIEAQGPDPTRLAELAHHFVRAAPAGSADKAAAYAARAADAALGVFAYEEAAAWYERAIEVGRLVDLGAATRGDLLMGLGAARLAQGDLPAARDAYLQSAELARGSADSERLARAALGLGSGLGGFEVGLFDRTQLDLLREALAALDPSDSSLRAWVLARLSVALSFTEPDTQRLELAEAAVAMARRLGEAAVLGYALASHCDAIAGPDHSETRELEATEVVRLAQHSGDRELELLGRRLRLVALLEQGRLGEADVEIDAFERVSAPLRQPLYGWYVPLWRAMQTLVRGDAAAAARWTREAETIGDAAHSENSAMLIATQRWLQARAAGRFPDAGQSLIDVFGAWAEQVGEPGWMGLALLQMGRADEARVLVSRMCEQYATRARDAEWLPSVVTLSQAIVDLEDWSGASILFDVLAPYSHRFAVEGIGAGFLGSVSWHLVPLARFLGRSDEAESYEAAAREAHTRIGVTVDPPALVPPKTASSDHAEQQALRASLDRSADGWSISYADRTVDVPDTKGIRDLATLLAAPDAEVHVSELAGTVTAQATDAALDARAVRSYRTRLGEIEADLAEMEANNDTGHVARLTSERDFLVAELTGALGLGGRMRRPGDPVERARKAVTARIRDCIAKISDVHPSLGRHLANSVRTGTLCSYRPEQPVIWRVATGESGIARR